MVSIFELNLRQLRVELKKRGLSPSGPKSDLVTRLSKVVDVVDDDVVGNVFNSKPAHSNSNRSRTGGHGKGSKHGKHRSEAHGSSVHQNALSSNDTTLLSTSNEQAEEESHVYNKRKAPSIHKVFMTCDIQEQQMNCKDSQSKTKRRFYVDSRKKRVFHPSNDNVEFEDDSALYPSTSSTDSNDEQDHHTFHSSEEEEEEEEDVSFQNEPFKKSIPGHAKYSSSVPSTTTASKREMMITEEDSLQPKGTTRTDLLSRDFRKSFWSELSALDARRLLFFEEAKLELERNCLIQKHQQELAQLQRQAEALERDLKESHIRSQSSTKALMLENDTKYLLETIDLTTEFSINYAALKQLFQIRKSFPDYHKYYNQPKQPFESQWKSSPQSLISSETYQQSQSEQNNE